MDNDLENHNIFNLGDYKFEIKKLSPLLKERYFHCMIRSITKRNLFFNIGGKNTKSSEVYNIDTESLYQVSEKFIKYVDTEYPIIHSNEIELNLIENPRLMEILFGIWVSSWQEHKGIEVNSYAQVPIRGSKQGYFIMTYAKNGKTEEIKSDTFINESLRIFNLITKLRHTSHMYDVSKFNIEITSNRKDKK